MPRLIAKGMFEEKPVPGSLKLVRNAGRRRAVTRALSAGLAGLVTAPGAGSAQPPVDAAYRPPVIALVQPPIGGSIPQDRPIVVFRFAQGEPADPIDAMSFSVTIDGQVRTAAFHVSGTEAWGSLASTAPADSARIAGGSHQVTARICSARGACATTAATVLVASAEDPHPTAAATPRAESKRQRLLNALLDAARRILTHTP